MSARSFEVPFNIWCDKCGEHIAKGERFNAEKKAIGNYHSTKILQFSMTHHCGCTICIQTDPKNAEYIVVEGARKKVGRAWGWEWGSLSQTRQNQDPWRLEGWGWGREGGDTAATVAACRPEGRTLFLLGRLSTLSMYNYRRSPEAPLTRATCIARTASYQHEHPTHAIAGAG